MKKVLILALGLILVTGIVFGIGSRKQQAQAATSSEKHYMCITIDADDTLWSIAQEHCTEEYKDYQAYIDEVKFINNLTNDTIYRGASLVIPYYTAPL